jgi:Caenorhabditis protein of unknown function, DUF268
MSRMLFNFLKNWVSLIGDPRKIISLRHFPRYMLDWVRYRRLPGSESLTLMNSFPCLSDWSPCTPFDPHYFYQAAWLARRLADIAPKSHVDIGSSVALIAVISAYVPTVFVDYRPLKTSIKALHPIAGDSLALPFSNNRLNSLSCLHVIEHIGLGRYGDPLNIRGTHLAAKELVRVLSPGGRLFLSTPVGRERTQFNAQRIFSPSSILAMFEGLRLENFSLIDDEGLLIQSADVASGETCEYGCGLFEMIK